MFVCVAVLVLNNMQLQMLLFIVFNTSLWFCAGWWNSTSQNEGNGQPSKRPHLFVQVVLINGSKLLALLLRIGMGSTIAAQLIAESPVQVGTLPRGPILQEWFWFLSSHTQAPPSPDSGWRGLDWGHLTGKRGLKHHGHVNHHTAWHGCFLSST